MKNLYNLGRIALLAIVLLGSFLAPDTSEAQTFKRGVLIEEATGTWCVHCALGAWAMDSLEHRLGDKAVVIAWHGPSGYNDPMIIEDGQGDTLLQSFGINSFPNALTNRFWAGGFGDLSNKGAFYVHEGVVEQEARKAPLVDYRIVNATYSPVTRRIDFDIDITPLNITKMKTEDTTQYVTVAVVTEDGISEQQANTSNHGGYPNGYIDFIHNNVARKAIGKVMGDKTTLGLSSPNATWPKRIHYGYFHSNLWEPSKLKVKTFVTAISHKTKTPQRHEVLEAEQTGYITALPQTAADMVYVFPMLQSYNDVELEKPIKIVFGKGGNVANVKLEFTVDDGATWETIVASTTQSPYTWTFVPEALSGKTVKIRASNAAQASTNGLSEPFDMQTIVMPAINVVTPVIGEVLDAGMSYNILWTESKTSGEKTVALSIDNGVTWEDLGKTPAEESFFSWTVPDENSATCLIRITDESEPPVVGTSDVFEIKKVAGPKPAFKTLTLAGVKNGNIPFSTPTTFSWTMENGPVVGTYYIEMSTDAKQTWDKITEAPQGSLSANWTTPDAVDGFIPAAFFRITTGSTEVGETFATGTSISIGNDAAVKNNGGTPTAFRLLSNYPNPFATTTNINFDVPERSFVTLVVRNELGQEVARLVSGNLDAGNYTVDFDASKLPVGFYTYTLESEGTKLTGKMSIVR